MARKKRLPLLVVDGYNVLRATPRYQSLIDPREGGAVMAQAGGRGRASGGGLIGIDPFERAREALLADVAAFAQGSYEAVIVYDGAKNLSPDRPNLSSAGCKIVFSQTGESADSVIERYVSQARAADREVALVTSDREIRAVAGLGPLAGSVTKISSQHLIQEMERVDVEVGWAAEERSHSKMTLEDRLSPEARAKLNAMLGR